MLFMTVVALLAAGASPPLTVVELFTSQGCSSCPPADKLLISLSKRDDVLPLSFHVDYWDRLGWPDPYASNRWTERQQFYVSAFGQRGAYTPELVVSGRDHTVGSQEKSIQELIRKHRAKRGLDLSVTGSRNGSRVRVKLENGKDKNNLHVVLFSPLSSNRVPSGENRGRALSHAHVVHALEPIGSWNGKMHRIELNAPKEASSGAIIQQGSSGEITGAKRFSIEQARD